MEREGIWRKYLPLSQCFSLLLPKNSHQFSSLRGTDARKQKSCIYNHQSIFQTAFMWSFKELARVSLNFPLGTGPRNIAGWEILMHHQLPRTLKGQRQSFAVIWPTICSPGKDLLPKGLSLLSWVSWEVTLKADFPRLESPGHRGFVHWQSVHLADVHNR